VNEVVRALVSRTKPPAYQNHPVKLLYATQVSTAAPTFVIWTNNPEGVTDSYQRYLQNGFRDAWGFLGVPIRINLRRRGEEEEHG
jgi:GTP-binding protein